MRVKSKQWRSSWSKKDRHTIGKREDESLLSSTIEGEMMKKKVFSVVVTVCLITMGAAAAAFAQMPGTSIRANIPFAFSVRGKTLPAGEYEIKRVFDSPDMLIISSVSRHEHEHAAFNTEPTASRKPLKSGELVFHRYGDSYFLAEILTTFDQMGHQLAPSHQEREARREMAINGKQEEPETVAVVVY